MQLTGQYTIPSFADMVSWASLLKGWREFQRGKRHKRDVSAFAIDLIHNLSGLHEDLTTGRYHHGGYVHFRVSDPKPRDIHKAAVRDRVVHHVLYRALYPYFARRFIHDSYSCQLTKGTHRALRQLTNYARQASHNYTRPGWILQGDIRKCFASIDHVILRQLLDKHIESSQTMALLAEVINSFSAGQAGCGIPLGNLTSQLFVNIYLHEFDQYVKRELHVKKYIRYADDFVLFSEDKAHLESLLPLLQEFLHQRLKLEFHPRKIQICEIRKGIDYLGWVHFPHHRVLRTSTKRRMIQVLGQRATDEVVASYLGLLRHGQTRKLRMQVFGDEGNRR